MKFRKDFVTNSSSSSFICDICGCNESGFDMTLTDAGMVRCANGHTLCEGEMNMPERNHLVEEILSYYDDNPIDHQYTREELDGMSDDDLLYEYICIGDTRYNVPEECCPICQFIEYSENDMARYLENKYGISREDVFAEVKKTNRRRKKLYDSEYVTHVCKLHDLNPADIAAGWKDEFGTYRNFLKNL